MKSDFPKFGGATLILDTEVYTGEPRILGSIVDFYFRLGRSARPSV